MYLVRIPSIMTIECSGALGGIKVGTLNGREACTKQTYLICGREIGARATTQRNAGNLEVFGVTDC